MIDRAAYIEAKEAAEEFRKLIAPILNNIDIIYRQAKIVVVTQDDGTVTTRPVLTPEQETDIKDAEELIKATFDVYQRNLKLTRGYS